MSNISALLIIISKKFFANIFALFESVSFISILVKIYSYFFVKK